MVRRREVCSRSRCVGGRCRGVGKKVVPSPLPHTHKKALATLRRPYSPEGRCACTRPQHASATLNGRPERILPGHLGPAGAPRGGRRHAATIWGWRATPTKHEAAGRRRPSASSCSRLGCRLGRRGAARPTISAAPCRDAHACSTTEKSRHLYRTQPARRRRDAAAAAFGTRNFPNFFPNL